MEFTEKFLFDFLKRLIAFDKDSRSIIGTAVQILKEQDEGEKKEWDKVRTEAAQKASAYAAGMDSAISDYQKQMDEILDQDIEEKKNSFARLQMCKEKLSLIASAEKSITDQSTYSYYSDTPYMLREILPVTA